MKISDWRELIISIALHRNLMSGTLQQNRKYIELIKIMLKMVLLVILFFYLSSTSLFLHVHYVDGQPLVHSHPYHKDGKNGQSGHTHDCAELILIQRVSTFDITDSIIPDFSFGIFCFHPQYLLSAKEISIPFKSPIFNFSLRAPPYLS